MTNMKPALSTTINETARLLGSLSAILAVLWIFGGAVAEDWVEQTVEERFETVERQAATTLERQQEIQTNQAVTGAQMNLLLQQQAETQRLLRRLLTRQDGQ